jgi:hypothetical protein
MRGNDRTSPVLFNGNSVVGYSYKNTGSYIARQYDLPDAEARYVDVYVDVNNPSGTTITPKVRLDDTGSWIPMTLIPADNKQLDQSYWEKHFIYDTGSNVDLKQKIHCRVDLTTDNKTITPKIKRFRSLARAI